MSTFAAKTLERKTIESFNLGLRTLESEERGRKDPKGTREESDADPA